MWNCGCLEHHMPLVWEITMPGDELSLHICTILYLFGFMQFGLFRGLSPAIHWIKQVVFICLIVLLSFSWCSFPSFPSKRGNAWAQLVRESQRLDSLDSIKLILREALVEKESLIMDRKNTEFPQQKQLLFRFCVLGFASCGLHVGTELRSLPNIAW